mmetsp:Transcript_16482/g.57649  ORF Transcript_16482/g.57649 Transcript_16482/m.57649 type:complete len:480 (-) Transcript_16482:280-1719(-)
MVFTMVQQLGVLTMIDLVWPPPLSGFFNLLPLVSFDISGLAVDCVGKLTPLTLFAARVLVIVGLFAVLMLIHAFVALVLDRGNLRFRATTLWASIGTVTMALLLSIVSGVVAPLQCRQHPNGHFTMRSDDAVVCWDDEFGSDHQGMVIVSVIACLFPTAFIAMATLAVLRLPQKVRDGEANFLHFYFFLFSRFRLTCHWYVLVFAARNFLVAVVPVLPGIAMQLCAMMLLMLVSLILVVFLMPWRFDEANALDVLSNASLLFIFLIGAMFVEDLDSHSLGLFALAVIVVVLMGYVIMLGASMYRRFLRKGKAFQFFSCHHKDGTGNLTRLLKLHLVENKQVHRKVFVDSDDLRDLSILFTYIQSETETLVVLCSRHILQRPWCVGEITTAFLNQVKLVRFALPDFAPPDDGAIAAYQQNESMLALAEHGMSIGMIQDALRWFATTPQLAVPAAITNKCMVQLVNTLVLKDGSGSTEPSD